MSCHKDDILNQEVECFVHQVVSHFPALKDIKKSSEKRRSLSEDVPLYWPDKVKKEALKPFILIKGEMNIQEGLILREVVYLSHNQRGKKY